MLASLGFALLAGVLSILSPCVLPLVPIVLGTASAEHRYAPAALAFGLTLSFVAIGLFVATLGFSLGLDAGLFRSIGAAAMGVIGLVLLLPQLQGGLARAAGPLSQWGEARFGAPPRTGLGGQFGVGLLLGAVWSPCVGPTLGAAAALASQGKDLVAVAGVMVAFGIGAALPLLGLGALSREALSRWRSRLLSAGRALKAALGAALIAVAILVLSGTDKAIEARLVEASPAWLTDLTTFF